ncbi:carboxymuconolactone decarboxylase family protein [Williamsia soli]|uniref:carboxymuconolactone decarboxylase family protein n=1 Tax=Williamsia soli TaxID=364929 RepID=UPI001A9E9CD9|nr:carboxymuconolactone decarboxylase family protein [Williamsia soli]
MTSDDTTGDGHSRYEPGLRVRREVMGDEFVDRALARTRGTESEAVQTAITDLVWGGVWTRPGLERRDRSLLNIGLLTALRAHEELAGHVRGALRNGLSRTEITEAVIHTSGYCGAPAAMSAMRIVQDVFDNTPAD